MDNLKGIIFQGCPQWSCQFMQGFLSSGTLGFYCTKNTDSVITAYIYFAVLCRHRSWHLRILSVVPLENPVKEREIYNAPLCQDNFLKNLS